MYPFSDYFWVSIKSTDNPKAIILKTLMRSLFYSVFNNPSLKLDIVLTTQFLKWAYLQVVLMRYHLYGYGPVQKKNLSTRQ